MAFDISNFKSNIAKYGTAQTNKFDVSIPINQNMSNLSNLGSRDIAELLTFRAYHCTLPGIKLETADNIIYGYGPAQKMPSNVTYTDTSLKFLADSDGKVYNFFYNWMKKIYSFDNGNNRPSFSLAYKYDETGMPNYVTDIYINTYDNLGNTASTYVLRGAYPTYINEIPMSWDDNNNLVKLDVGISYFTWSYTA